MFTKFWPGNLKAKALGRPRRGWEYNIKMDLKERVCWCGLDSSGAG
jgi:hypothetical protein